MERTSVVPVVATQAEEGAVIEGRQYELTAFADTSTYDSQEPEKSPSRVIAVIPAYNEDRFIGSVLLKIRPFVDKVVVVDDGSKDRTADVAREAGAEVIVHEVNRGKAAALQTGFNRALELDANAVVILDADGQHSPEEVPVVVAPVLAGNADMVIGSRFAGTKSDIPVWRQAGQHALTLVTNIASGVRSSDSQSGFRAFRPDALATLRISGEGFAVESELQFWAREQSLRVVEAPITVTYAEKAKRNPVQQALQVLNGVLSLVSQSRPLLFFGVSGLVIALLGVGFWYRIVQTYNLTGQLDLGPVILATFFITLGVLATFEGITLHTMRRMMLHSQHPGAIRVKLKTDGRDDCTGQASVVQEFDQA
jgi:glycosyltransferase involved in cell wall biosynthesis